MSRTDRHPSKTQRIAKADAGEFDWRDYPRWKVCQDLRKKVNRKERYAAKAALRKGIQPERVFSHKMVKSLAWLAS